MKLKRTSRRLVKRIALGLAVVAVAAPSAGGMYGLPMTGYNDNVVKNAALAHAYDVWKQNGGDQVTASVGTGYVSAPSGPIGPIARPESGVQAVTGSVGPSWVAPGLVAPADPAADGFRTAVSNLTESSTLRNYDLIPQHVLDESGAISRPAPGVRFFGPIGQVSQPVPGGNGPIGPISRPESGAVIPSDLSGRQFGPAALPSATASTPVTVPDSRFGPGRALPVASPGEEFTWDDATIGIVAGLGTALIAAMIGVALLSRRDRFARA
jgi:hypothetical protein